MEHKEMPLTQGKIALVDVEDYDYLCQFKWHKHKPRNIYYAARNTRKNGKKALSLMHREILKTPKGFHTDHINGDGLDNRRNNLRICTGAQNLMNRGKTKANKSGFKGVCWNKANKKWHAQIEVDGKNKHLGFFDVKEQAALAYNEAALKYYDEFAKLNNL